MSFPRIHLISFSDRLAICLPRSFFLPSETFKDLGSNPNIAVAVKLFPLPLSPARPSISPGLIFKFSFLTTFFSFCPLVPCNVMERSFISSKGGDWNKYSSLFSSFVVHRSKRSIVVDIWYLLSFLTCFLHQAYLLIPLQLNCMIKRQ